MLWIQNSQEEICIKLVLVGEPSPVPTSDPLSRKSAFNGINKAYVCALSC